MAPRLRNASATSTRLRAAMAALVAIALIGLGGPASRAETFEERAMAQAQERVALVEARLRDARGSAAVAAGRLAELQLDMDNLERAVNRAAEAVDQQRAEVERAGIKLDELQAEVVRVEEALAIQVITLFKRGSSAPFGTILGAGDISSAIERAEFVRVLATGEKASLEGLRNARVNLAAQRERYAVEQARLVAFQEQQTALLVRAIAARDEAAAILAGASGTVRSLEQQHDDLAQDAAALADLIRRNSAAPTSGLAPSTAGYIWPICGIVTSEYGRRWGRMHEGIDIDGDTGDVIAAVKAGSVIFAGQQGGYGNLVLVDHGDGVVTAYAHQSAIYVNRGDAVVRGQKLGAVGSTGHSTGPHLHFETRVGGQPENPRRFLSAGC